MQGLGRWDTRWNSFKFTTATGLVPINVPVTLTGHPRVVANRKLAPRTGRQGQQRTNHSVPRVIGVLKSARLLVFWAATKNREMLPSSQLA